MKKVFGAILFVFLIFAFFYIFTPAINPTSANFWFCIVFFPILISAIALFFIKYILDDDIGILCVIMWILSAVVLVFIAITSLIGSPVFNSKTYMNTIEVAEGDFSSDYPDISKSDSYTVLDLDTAKRLGDRVLGQVPNASWYEIDSEYNLIMYHGRQYRISPLNYGGFFKFLKARKTGIPGYVLVDCEKLEASFVETMQPIYYSPSGYFDLDLERHLRFQYPKLIFDSHFMEIDENGTPYWVTAVVNKQAGLWGAKKVVKFVLTNACTGKSELYNIDEKPEWLDHVYSLQYMMRVADWHYKYVNGWWNNLFSETGVLKTTYSYGCLSDSNAESNFYGYNSFLDSNNNVMIFTGLTPANKTESNVGFITINASTGEFTFYNISGAEESSAQSVVEGLVQNMGYQATYPIVVNIAGIPTYLMNLKDKSGLIQRYAMVNIQDYTNAYVGATFEETLDGYLDVIGVGKVREEVVEEIKIMESNGVIEEMHQAEIDGTTYFYYVINDILYRASIKVNEEQVLFKVGDSVKIMFYYADNNLCIVKDISR